MKVYRVEFDHNNYQSFNPVDMSRENRARLRFDGTRKAATWTPVKIDVPLPKLPVPDIFYFSQTFVVSKRVLDIVDTPFSMAGELLPVINEEGEEMLALNITECINVLDREKTKFSTYSGGKGYNPVKYAFRERFGVSSIFTIPDCPGCIYCWERTGDLEYEFKAIVEHHKLKGLNFTEIWRSPDEPPA